MILLKSCSWIIALFSAIARALLQVFVALCQVGKNSGTLGKGLTFLLSTTSPFLPPLLPPPLSPRPLSPPPLPPPPLLPPPLLPPLSLSVSEFSTSLNGIM